MAEFVEVTKIAERLCKTHKASNDIGKKCSTCPLASLNNGGGALCIDFRKDYPEEYERICLEWAKEHPVQTNADKFKEVFGQFDDIYFKGCAGFYCKGRSCDSCERNDFWNREYKAPTEEVSE